MESKPSANPFEKFNPEPFLNQLYNKYEITLSPDEAILYALSIGFSLRDHLNRDHLKFTYDYDPGFQIFPTMIQGWANKRFNEFTKFPGFPIFDNNMLRHGEDTIEIIKPMKPDGTKYICEQRFIDFQDKGKMTVLVADRVFTNAETGEVHAKMVTQGLILGTGGFGYKGTTGTLLTDTKPEREPDFVVEEELPKTLALLYRLTSDRNPFHVNPDLAKAVGFKEPIAMGLSHYGFACRAVYDKYGEGKADNIKKMSVRFTSHVHPGETLVIEMWKDDNKVYFETKTKERGAVVLKASMVFN
jgi:acyl dehydratase